MSKRKSASPRCCHCGKDARLTRGHEIYPHRPDLHGLWFWVCRDCNAYVGCHKLGARVGKSNHKPVYSDGTLPLGTPANERLRRYRSAAHEVFDRVWKTKQVARQTAYSLMANKMGIPKDECHIALFDIKQCKQFIRIAVEEWPNMCKLPAIMQEADPIY